MTLHARLSAASVTGGVGVAGAAIPSAASLVFSQCARALGAAVEVDMGSAPPGELLIVECW